MEAVRIFFYILTILSATVTWCLAAAFLALTQNRFRRFWRGDIALLVFGILAMLVLPCIMLLGLGSRRRSLTGPTVAEALTVFVFWALFLAGTAKFSRSYHAAGWASQCRLGWNLCPTGRALLAFGWITFGLLSILLVTVIVHGFMHERRRKHDEQQAANMAVGNENRQIDPHATNSQATAVAGKHPQEASGGGGMSQVPQGYPTQPVMA
ncbi:uncharacterized protein JCM6883_003590 [Sporobolomyces salmoneus]|uniref:uncharacterized protein n=1 Tax=Sporobolomyces salmoneus TaxID=183962 RepID=UPI00317DFF9C